MIMLVLLSSVAGLIMKEWKQCSTRTKRILAIALCFIDSRITLTYGNYLGDANKNN